MWFINTAHKWIIVLNGHDNSRDRPWTWLVERLGVYVVLNLMSWLEHQEHAPAGCPCISLHFFPLTHTHTQLWAHTHEHTYTHTDLHLWRIGWWGLGAKRQSTVPWRRSSGSGQDSARCNPSQVMLFTFSRFQLICLNAPSSSHKKPPPPPQAAQSPRTTRRREGCCHSRLSNLRSLFSVSLQAINLTPHMNQIHKLFLFYGIKNMSGCKAHITWIRVASCEKALLTDMPSVGLFHFFQRQEWQGLFKSSLLECSLSPLGT